RGINEGDGRLDIRTGLRLEDEARPRDVHAIAEWTRGIGVHRDPFLVIEGAGRSRLIDECRRSPAQRAGTIEGPAVYGDRTGRAGAIESEACIVDVAPAVESDGRITARIVDATREALHAGNQSSEMLGISGHTAPVLTSIVREVCARITVPERAAGRTGDAAAPCARDVVVRGGHDTHGIVGVHGDGRFVLWRCRGVLVHEVGNRSAVQRAREYIGRRNYVRCRSGRVEALLLDERGEADLQAGGS